jgi:DNA replication protein DnaC
LKHALRWQSYFRVKQFRDFGNLPMIKQGNYNLFQLINALYEYRSIILTTNKDFTNWGEFFIYDNVAVPIVDRLIHHSHIFMLGGESYRLKQKLTN